MPQPAATASPVSRFDLGGRVGALAVLAAIVATYRNGLDGPFVLDDVAAIVENPTIRDFSAALTPPADRGLPVTGRPLVNLSLALNYAWSGIGPRSYHIVNVALHALTALVLLGVMRRVFQAEPLRARFGAAATALATIATACWALHPLQTAAVTYVSQRAEVLLALFFLLTLYAFQRHVAALSCGDTQSPTTKSGWVWSIVAVGACAAGMATKEVMVVAPLLVLLYDRTFVAGTFVAAWRQRWRLHTALMATWGVLAAIMLSTGTRGGTAGFKMGISPWDYALKQCDAIIHYLRLAFWPTPLVFDYGGAVLVEKVSDVGLQIVLLALLVGATLFALWRRPVLGFAGIWVFAILAPTSSVVPLADTMFEHRLYLPLAAIAALLVGASWALGGRKAVVALALAALALGSATAQRNTVYRSELTLWRDTVAKRPQSVRAHYTLGSVFTEHGLLPEAIAEHEMALRLNPRAAQAHNNLANVLVRLERFAEAAPHYEAALAVQPTAEAHSNYGGVLVRLGRREDAGKQFAEALRLRPDLADAHNNLANLLAQAGDLAAAEPHFREAVRLRPDHADAHANLGNVLAQTGRLADALPCYEAALRLRPDFADAHYNLATTLGLLRRWSEALSHYEAVLKLQPNYRGAREGRARAEAMHAALGK